MPKLIPIVENNMKCWEGILGVSYGAGVNSSALLVGLKEHDIKPDYIIFVDTAGNDPKRLGEKPETYDYLDNVIRPWCRENLEQDIIVVGHLKDSLRNSCFRNETLPSKAYGFPGCSIKFKHYMMENFEKQEFGHEQIITKAIGYHAKEKRGSDINEKERYRYKYFLKEWGWDQQPACVDALTRHGLSIPMKSACYFCPSSKAHEIIWLRDTHPDLFADAIAMEKNAEKYHQAQLMPDGSPRTKGLGRSFSWQQFVNITPQGAEELPEPDEIPCMCYDGE